MVKVLTLIQRVVDICGGFKSLQFRNLWMSKILCFAEEVNIERSGNFLVHWDFKLTFVRAFSKLSSCRWWPWCWCDASRSWRHPRARLRCQCRRWRRPWRSSATLWRAASWRWRRRRQSRWRRWRRSRNWARRKISIFTSWSRSSPKAPQFSISPEVWKMLDL